MNRILLIARREFLAYAKTVGFWLSLLAFPLFAVLGGAIPALMNHAEPVREAVIIDETPAGSGLAVAVRQALNEAMAEEMRRDPRVFVMGEECSNLIVPPDRSRLTNPIVSKGIYRKR